MDLDGYYEKWLNDVTRFEVPSFLDEGDDEYTTDVDHRQQVIAFAHATAVTAVWMTIVAAADGPMPFLDLVAVAGAPKVFIRTYNLSMFVQDLLD